MTATADYEHARLMAHELRNKLLTRTWRSYVFKPLETMHLVHQYLDADAMAWIKMHSLLMEMAAKKRE